MVNDMYLLANRLELSLFGRASLQVRQKQDWGQRFILLLPQAQMLAVIMLSHHQVLSSKTVRPYALYGA